MDTMGSDLFQLADRRLTWITQRAALLAQNVANADTPGWKSRDLQPFAATLDQFAVAPAATDPRHLAAAPPSASGSGRKPSERAPDGNAVSMDAELVKLAGNDTDHALVTDIYKKYLSLYRTALGR